METKITERARSRDTLRLAISLATLATLLLAITVMGGCNSGKTGESKTAPAPSPIDLLTVSLPFSSAFIHTPQQAAEYVGSAVCTGCHPNEAEKHRKTPHALAVHLATVTEDGEAFRLPARLTDTELQAVHSPMVKGDKLFIHTTSVGVSTDTQINLAMGSGTHGITYLAVQRDGSSLTPPISTYRINGKMQWGWTPNALTGLALRDPSGKPLPAAGTAQCVGCHSTSVQASLRLTQDRLGIGCEKCHGPAAQHINIVGSHLSEVKSGKMESGMARLHELRAEQILAICNSCHHALGEQAPSGLPSDLARAQPQALMMSRCFQQSQGKLTCTTCHDPHTPVQKETLHYEKACLQCHSAQQPKSTLCPVNKTSGCIDCHMGKETIKVFNATLFTHHWIRKKLPPPEARK